MIAYLDTSAIVPLLIEEPSSPACQRVWDDADDVVASRLGYVETAAVLAQGERQGRLTSRHRRAALRNLDDIWAQLQIADVDQVVVERATQLSHQFALRGYDAVHAATAELVGEADTVGASGDRQLLDAWRALGIATYDTNRTA